MLSKTSKAILVIMVNMGSYFWALPISYTNNSSLPRFSVIELETFWKAFFAWILTSSVTIILITFVKNRYIIAAVTNDWIQLLEYFRETYFPSWDSKMRSSGELLMKGLLAFSFAIPCSTVMDYLIHPFDLTYELSLLHDHPFLFIPFYLPFGFLLFHLYVMASIPGLVLVSTCALPTIIAGRYMLPELKQMKSNSNYTTKSTLREPKNLFHAYKSFQLVVLKLNESFSDMLTPLYNMQTYSVITSIFAMIRFYEALHTVLKLIICVAVASMVFQWTTALYIGGMVLKRSTALIDSWKRTPWGKPRDKKYIKRMCKSCRPIALSFGHFYTVKMMRVLMFLHFILWGTLRALLIL